MGGKRSGGENQENMEENKREKKEREGDGNQSSLGLNH